MTLAVAAPVQNNTAVLTNRAWSIDGDALARRFGLRRVVLLNDFEAVAYCLPQLTTDDRLLVGDAMPRADLPALVLGPGTGFGASLWLPEAATAVATEGGHAWLAAANELESAVLARAADTGQPLSVEALVSGPGIGRLHQLLHGGPVAAAPQAADIFAAAATDAAIAGDRAIQDRADLLAVLVQKLDRRGRLLGIDEEDAFHLLRAVEIEGFQKIDVYMTFIEKIERLSFCFWHFLCT